MRLNRRRLLSSAAALPLLGSPLLHAAAAALPSAPLLVLVYLKGGNDSYNTYVALNDPKYRRLRPTLALERDQLIPFSPSHGFHPALAPLLPAWQSGEMALLQGIGQQEVTNQHYRDLEMQFTGASPDQYPSDGWLTRAMLANPAMRGTSLDALAFGDLDIRVADPMGPFRGDKLRVINIQHPADWLTAGSTSAVEHLATSPQTLTGRPLTARPAPTPLQTVFPADEFGDALRATVMLAAAGMAPPVVHITLNAASGDHHDAFDTHWDQRKYHGPALTRLAGGLAALRRGMQEIGQWNRTLVATYDEFGRCPKENERGGTHHGWASTHMALGGRIRGGLLGEPVPLIDVFAIDGPPPVIDTRAFYTTVIERWWGGSARGVFERRFTPLELLRA